MKYIKLFENFSLDDKLERMRYVLNLIGISLEYKAGFDRTFYVIYENGQIIQKYSDHEAAVAALYEMNKNSKSSKYMRRVVEHEDDIYTFNCDLVLIRNSLVYNILSKHYLQDCLYDNFCYITDSNGFLIDKLEYYSSRNKGTLEDPTIVSFRKSSDKTVMSKLFKNLIDHFSSCSDSIYLRFNKPSSNSVNGELEIKGLGNFIESYLKLNKSCNGEVKITKKMASYFLKNSSADYNTYGNMQKNYPLVYDMLNSVNKEVKKSSDMSGMGFGD
jgi:hypothetical protein